MLNWCVWNAETEKEERAAAERTLIGAGALMEPDSLQSWGVRAHREAESGLSSADRHKDTKKTWEKHD